MKLSSKITGVFIAFLLGVLGFSSCGDKELRGAAEYGVPNADFKVIGTLVDSGTGQPVRGLKTKMSRLSEGEIVTGEQDSGYTNESGKFSLSVNSWPDQNADFLLEIEDVDGKANGSYENSSVTVQFRNASFDNGNSWYRGEVSQDVGEIGLEVKND